MSETVYDFGPVASTDALCNFLEDMDPVAFKAEMLSRIGKGITNNQFKLVREVCEAVSEAVIRETEAKP